MKALRFLLFLLLFFIVYPLFPQYTFQKVYHTVSEDFASSCCTSYEGHLIFLCGGSIIKTDTLGNHVWTKKYLPDGMSRQGVVKQQSNGGILIVYEIISGGIGGSDIMIFNLDTAGIVNWIRIFGTPADDTPEDIVELGDGSFVICGSTNSFGGRAGLVLMMAVNKFGDQLWQRSYGSSSGESGKRIIRHINGGLLSCGRTDSAFIIKTNDYGIADWYRTFNAYVLNDMVQDTAGGDIFACGYRQVPPDSGVIKAVIICTDADGVPKWTRVFGDSLMHVAYSLCLNHDGSRVYVSGVGNKAIGTRAFTACFDAAAGNILHAYDYGRSPGMNIFYDNLFIHNSLFAAGYSAIPMDDYDNIYLVRTNTSGISGCNEQIFTPGCDTALLFSALSSAASDSGNLDVTSVCYPANTIVTGEIALCASAVPAQYTTDSIRAFPTSLTSGDVLYFTGLKSWENYHVKMFSVIGREIISGELKNHCLLFSSPSKGCHYYTLYNHDKAIYSGVLYCY